MQKFLRALFYTLTGILVLLVSFVGFSALWGLTTWGDLDVNEVIFQLSTPLEGTGNGMIGQYILKGILPTLLVFAAFLVIMKMLGSARKRMVFACLCLAASIVAGIAVKQYIWRRLNVNEWLAGQTEESTFIEDNYADPSRVKLTFPGQKRNLIYIYLESMETTYADPESGGAFPSNVIPELTALAMEEEDFSGNTTALNGGIVYPGSTNTMSAIFAHSSGLPIKADIGNNLMDTQDTFFPKVTTIGDILQEEGYRQIFLLGSNATFGGRRLFFKDHGNFEIRDYQYAKENGWIPSDYKVFWGFEDEKLFGFAKDTLGELAAEDKPFNLTILTVDTHFEDGYVCNLCGDEFGDNQYANVFACSSRQVADFISWVKEQDFYDNTTIVLTGDHTTMDKDFCKGVDSSYLRRTYTAFINPAAEPQNRDLVREYSTMDSFPTTLAAMGVEIEGNRLGLGTNLFSDRQTLTEEFGRTDVRTQLLAHSSFLQELEDFDLKSDALMARIKNSMERTLEVTSYDPEQGKVGLAVTAYFEVDSVEANYKEKRSGKGGTQAMDLREGTFRTYDTILDISDWESTDGRISINMTALDGTVYKEIVEADLGDLIEAFQSKGAEQEADQGVDQKADQEAEKKQ